MDNTETQRNMEMMSQSQEPPTKRKYFIERTGIDIANENNNFNKEQSAVKLKRSMELLMSWPNWDMWPFKMAAPVVGLTATIPGYILNTAFRNALLLGHYAKVSSYLATMGLPSVIGTLAHGLVISSDILEQKTKCPVCLQVKSASLQLAIGFVYPLIFVPIANFPTAAAIKNLYFPKIHKEPREVLKYTLEILRPVKDRYLMTGALQIVVAMGATYLQQQCYANTLLPILTGEKTVTKKL